MIVSQILKFLNSALGKIMFFLPSSPFDAFINNMEDLSILAQINYFIPLQEMIMIGELWLVSITLFYVYSAILRWVKAID